MKPAVIIPWRKGETELQTTIDSAKASIGKGIIIPAEDRSGDGPAMTRHRGIEAATEADVIILVDAHMQFMGDVLRAMAREVARRGGLLCAKCYHNADCSFDGAYYAGADIHFMGDDQNGHQALLWKWSADKTPGPRACIGGACYVFSRSWYYETGQCLSALPAWGCDEEALSITAWMSGHRPRVYDGAVAHRYRSKTPWPSAARPIVMSRAALISAVVSDDKDRSDLLKWQGVQPCESSEVLRWRGALLNQHRTWAGWKQEVPIMPKPVEIPRKPSANPSKPNGRANYGAHENNRTCRCGSVESIVESTRISGRMIVRYRRCKQCGKRRPTQEVLAETVSA